MGYGGAFVAAVVVGCVVATLFGVVSIERGAGFMSPMKGMGSGSGGGSGADRATSAGSLPATGASKQRPRGPSSDIVEQFPSDSIDSVVCDDEASCQAASRRDVIRSLRKQCSSFRHAFQTSRVKSPVSSLDGLTVNDVSGELVCAHRGDLYSDESSALRRTVHTRRALLNQLPIVVDMKELTSSLPLSKAAKVTLSRSIALVILDCQAGFHLFHLLADNVLPLAWHLFGNPSPNATFLETLRRSVLFLTQSSQRHQIGKCKACVEMVETFAPRVLYAHQDDDAVQCFCGGYFSSVVYLPYHESMHSNRERSAAVRWLQQALAAHFGLPTYTGKRLLGGPPSTASSPLSPPLDESTGPKSELGLASALQRKNGSQASSCLGGAVVVVETDDDDTKTAASGGATPPVRPTYRMNGQPRLLLVQRKTRSIGPIAAILHAAEALGFDVAFTFFEGLPMQQQFRLARLADVFVSIHGMALTWGFAMDGSTEASRGCRTMIELRHFVRPFKLKLQFYKHMASSANLTYVELEATNCKFGPSVRQPAKEKNRMWTASHPMGLKGFHDQVADYDVGQVQATMAAAYARALTCPT